MALHQIAFDFDSVPAPPPRVENKPAVKKEPAPGKGRPGKSTRGRMAIRDMEGLADLVEVPEDTVLFGRSYYSMSEVAGMFKISQSLLRFWANEFDVLKPRKNGKGDRLFRPEDVKNLQLIYHLLRERKYTVEGAKDFIKNSKKADEKFAMIESLKRLKAFLLELKTNL